MLLISLYEIVVSTNDPTPDRAWTWRRLHRQTGDAKRQTVHTVENDKVASDFGDSNLGCSDIHLSLTPPSIRTTAVGRGWQQLKPVGLPIDIDITSKFPHLSTIPPTSSCDCVRLCSPWHQCDAGSHENADNIASPTSSMDLQPGYSSLQMRKTTMSRCWCKINSPELCSRLCCTG